MCVCSMYVESLVEYDDVRDDHFFEDVNMEMHFLKLYIMY